MSPRNPKPSRHSSRARSNSRVPASIFAALGDATRLALVNRLADRQPHSISQLAEGSRITRQAITKHLRVLERAGLVRCARVGRESHFEFNLQPMLEMRQYLDHISAQWDESLSRLKSLVEE
jgi:DNA-binding transcriptional ArsR family regulator